MSTQVTASQATALHLQQISKQFAGVSVLQGINLQINAGEFIAIVGRSGCGKSTLLRVLAGLETLSGGELRSYASHKTRLMFQDDRLLPWKSVLHNIGLGLQGNWQEQAYQALQEVGLADKAHAWPAQLSGGQRQRVALARALIHKPHLLLLDEPLGALDALTRLEMQELIERVWQEHQFTVVLVTHDVPEAVQLADRIIVLESGRVKVDLLIDLPRPRDTTSVAAVSYSAQILREVLGHRQQTTPHTHPTYPTPIPALEPLPSWVATPV